MSARAEGRAGRIRRRTALLFLGLVLALVGDGFLDACSDQADDSDLTERTSSFPSFPAGRSLPPAVQGAAFTATEPPGRPPWR